MPTKHDKYNLALDRFEIDSNRYRELYHFCKQYHKYKSEAEAIRGWFNASGGDGMPKGAGGHSDPTAKRAERVARIQKKITDIETACHAAADDRNIYSQLLKNVVDNIRYEDMHVPCGKNQFYAARRKFFWELSKLRD